MNREFSDTVTDRFKELYDDGYRCINYEIDEKERSFTVYLKNFESEKIETLKCNAEEGAILKKHVDRISQQTEL